MPLQSERGMPIESQSDGLKYQIMRKEHSNGNPER